MYARGHTWNLFLIFIFRNNYTLLLVWLDWRLYLCPRINDVFLWIIYFARHVNVLHLHNFVGSNSNSQRVWRNWSGYLDRHSKTSKGECCGGFSGKISTGFGIKWYKNCCRQVDKCYFWLHIWLDYPPGEAKSFYLTSISTSSPKILGKCTYYQLISEMTFVGSSLALIINWFLFAREELPRLNGCTSRKFWRSCLRNKSQLEEYLVQSAHHLQSCRNRG